MIWYSTCMYIYDHIYIYVKKWIEISYTTENLPWDPHYSVIDHDGIWHLHEWTPPLSSAHGFGQRFLTLLPQLEWWRKALSQKNSCKYLYMVVHLVIPKKNAMSKNSGSTAISHVVPCGREHWMTKRTREESNLQIKLLTSVSRLCKLHHTHRATGPLQT